MNLKYSFAIYGAIHNAAIPPAILHKKSNISPLLVSVRYVCPNSVSRAKIVVAEIDIIVAFLRGNQQKSTYSAADTPKYIKKCITLSACLNIKSSELSNSLALANDR